jgi:hypothetical protein
MHREYRGHRFESMLEHIQRTTSLFLCFPPCMQRSVPRLVSSRLVSFDVSRRMSSRLAHNCLASPREVRGSPGARGEARAEGRLPHRDCWRRRFRDGRPSSPRLASRRVSSPRLAGPRLVSPRLVSCISSRPVSFRPELAPRQGEFKKQGSFLIKMVVDELVELGPPVCVSVSV